MLARALVAPASVTSPTGLMRESTCASVAPVSSRLTPVTSCDSSRKSTIGTRNASASTIASCLGVFIGEMCSSCIVEFPARVAEWTRPHAAASKSSFARTAADEARIITRVHAARKSAGDRAPHPCARWTLRCAAGRIRLRAPVAQLDRVLVSEAKGHRFDSCRARHDLRSHARATRCRIACAAKSPPSINRTNGCNRGRCR